MKRKSFIFGRNHCIIKSLPRRHRKSIEICPQLIAFMSSTQIYVFGFLNVYYIDKALADNSQNTCNLIISPIKLSVKRQMGKKSRVKEIIHLSLIPISHVQRTENHSRLFYSLICHVHVIYLLSRGYFSDYTFEGKNHQHQIDWEMFRHSLIDNC